MSRRRRARRSLADINIVPYIDVMLVLLVIFMITTPLLSEGVSVNLPQAKAKALTPKDALPLVVSVDEKGHYYLNSGEQAMVPLSPEQLSVRIAAELSIAKEKGEKRDVLVKGDKDVQYGEVMQAMVLLQQAGVENVGLMTQDPNEKKA